MYTPPSECGPACLQCSPLIWPLAYKQTTAESAQAVYTLMYGAPAGGVRCV